MLQDRDYMRRNREEQPDRRARSGVVCLYGIILANFLLFLFFNDPVIIRTLILSPALVQEGELWRFATTCFLHADFSHLLFNMIGLYCFGPLASQCLGWKKFLGLFLAAGIAGNLLWYLANFQNPNTLLLGASGGVMGVILAGAMLAPDVKVYLLFVPFPVKLKTLAVIYILLEVFQQLAESGGHVAYLAHIGGFIGSWLFMKFFARKEVAWEPVSFFFRFLFRRKNPSPEQFSVHSPEQGRDLSPRNVDHLLDKLYREGINSLTEEEQETLRRAREEILARRGR